MIWTDKMPDRKILIMIPKAGKVVAEIAERNGEESSVRCV